VVIGKELYVADYDNHRISVFTTAGKFLRTIESDLFFTPEDSSPTRRAACSWPMIRAATSSSRRVPSSRHGTSASRASTATRTGVEVLPDGRILLSERDLNRVQIVTYP